MECNINPDRTVQEDWYPHKIPSNVCWGNGFYLETSYSFKRFQSKCEPALVFGEHVSCYAGCSFAIGEKGFCSIGNFTMMNGALLMVEERIEIGDHCLIAWNVGIADCDFHPLDPTLRIVDSMALAPFLPNRPKRPALPSKSVKIGNNVWIGMNAIILKGVTIGNNSIIGAGAVVVSDIPGNVMVAGNPARIIKTLDMSIDRSSQFQLVVTHDQL